MSILKRFRIGAAVVSVLKRNTQIEIEIVGCNSTEHEKGLRNYLVNEGIFDAILQGGNQLEFDKKNMEND